MSPRRSTFFILAASTMAMVVGLGSGCRDDGNTSGTSSSSGGIELPPLPDLDPAGCPIVADSGEDPTIADAAEAQWSRDYVAPAGESIEEEKAFFLATLIRADGPLSRAIASDATLSSISAERDARMRAVPTQCTGTDEAGCEVAALTWSSDEAMAAADAFESVLENGSKLSTFATAMRASGRFAAHAGLDDGALVRAAVLDLVVALSDTLNDEIGSLGGDELGSVVDGVIAAHPSPLAFFEPLLEVDLAALTADGRDEASRYEPLDQGENAAAIAHLPAIDWDAYPFTAIVVPGQGPTDPKVVLDPTGQFRCELAHQRFDAGLAPLIVVSGGHVHPDRTKFSEAIEMKKYLMETHAVPEEAILVDPHARHTTTNLRNVSRIFYRAGLPTDRPMLITSDFGQSLYIAFWHGMFGPRCMDELGYLPWRSLTPISTYDGCMIPTAVSLHADGRDPLDP